MNAAAKALSQGNVFNGDYQSVYLPRQFFSTGLWLLLVVTSALAVVYLKNIERQTFSELQAVKQQKANTRLEKGRLLLEKSTLAAPSRVAKIATGRLNMQLPNHKKVIIARRTQ